MAKGSTGSNTGSIVKLKKVTSKDAVKCDCKKCSRCIKFGKNVKQYYCKWFDIYDPNKKKCTRYLKK